ncbi:MAG: hypothetical protein ACTH0F_06665, partial [Microbacterium sp.]
PQFVGIGIAIVLILALIIILPAAPDILAAFQLWWLAIAAGCAIGISALGTWLLLRSAPVR